MRLEGYCNRTGRHSQPATRLHRLWPLLFVAAGSAAYANSFAVPFLFDDQSRIIDNPRLRHLRLLTGAWRGANRPLVELSLAVNYACGGLRVWGYHAVNLAIHLLAGLALFGLIRRTLQRPTLAGRYEPAAPWLAATAVLIWLLHPLQTQSVTYVIQRAESLAALWYLLALYGLVRGAASRHPAGWYALTICCGGLGAASKTVMVTLPLVALLYDRTFLAGSCRRALRQRAGLYVGLTVTSVAAVLFALRPDVGRQVSAGFGFKDVTPWDYAMTQPGVILQYLRLVVWPSRLVFDYEWPVAGSLRAVLAPGLLVTALGAATVWALARRPALGFPAAWWFLTLAPSSSIVPIRDLAVEHRTYLPLAGLAVLAAVGGYEGVRALKSFASDLRRGAAAAGLLLLTGALGALTFQRNADYRSDEAIWRDTVRKRPENARAHTNLGVALSGQGRVDEALEEYAAALRLQPEQAEAHSNRGAALAKQGRLDEAIAEYREALRLRPDYAPAENNLGVALARQEKSDAAIPHYLEALRLMPDNAQAHNNLCAALTDQRRFAEAIAHCAEAIRLRPEYAEAHNTLGNALLRQGRLEAARLEYLEALRLQPDSAAPRANLKIIKDWQAAEGRRDTLIPDVAAP